MGRRLSKMLGEGINSQTLPTHTVIIQRDKPEGIARILTHHKPF
jgi:hypothetical protein